MPNSAKASAKRRGLNRDATVRWRDGVHLSNTAIWCDARRARDICFVSVAGAVGRSKHGQLIASAPTLALLDTSGPTEGTRLLPPFGQPFTLGQDRLELFRSGHGMGSASLLLRQSDQSLLYAGAVNAEGSALGGSIDHRRADTLVVRATYGEKLFAFALQEARERLHDGCRRILARSGVAVLLVTSTVKALDMAVLLEEMSLPARLHSRYHDAAKRAREHGFALPLCPRFSATRLEAQVVLWPVHARAALEKLALPKGSEIILVSGRAAQSAAVRAVGADAGIAISNQADHSALIRYIESCGASSVYLTGSSDQGADLAAALPHHSLRALGPPTQLQLF